MDAWSLAGNMESGLLGIKEKISKCGSDLQAWGASKTHLDEVEIKKVQKGVEELSMAKPTMENKNEFLATRKILDALLLKQEIYWAQRSRVSWMKHGNRNTKYFHFKASQRQRRNFIYRVRDQNNAWVEELEKVVGVAIEYFENIFWSGICQRMEECLNAVQHKVTSDMQDILSSDYSVEEIKVTLFQRDQPRLLNLMV